MDALAARVTDPKTFRIAMVNRQDRLLAEGIPAQRDAQWQKNRPTSPRPSSTSPSASNTPSAAPHPQELPPTAGPTSPSMS